MAILKVEAWRGVQAAEGASSWRLELKAILRGDLNYKA